MFCSYCKWNPNVVIDLHKSMMTAADINTAQVSLQCSLCNEQFHRFCNTCQLGLCEDCIGKHVSLPLRLHVIVPYINRTEQNVFSWCIHHPCQKYEAYCQHCDVPLCIECLAASQHETHEVINVVEKRKLIKKETEEITNLICKNGSAKVEVDGKIYNLILTFQICSDRLNTIESNGI